MKLEIGSKVSFRVGAELTAKAGAVIYRTRAKDGLWEVVLALINPMPGTGWDVGTVRVVNHHVSSYELVGSIRDIRIME